MGLRSWARPLDRRGPDRHSFCPNADLLEGLPMTVAGTIRTFASRVHSVTSALRERNALRSEFAELSSTGELDRVLADAGLSRSQISTLVENHPSASHLLTGMMEQLGLDMET